MAEKTSLRAHGLGAHNVMLKSLQWKKDILKISTGGQAKSAFHPTSPFYPAVILSAYCLAQREAVWPQV